MFGLITLVFCSSIFNLGAESRIAAMTSGTAVHRQLQYDNTKIIGNVPSLNEGFLQRAYDLHLLQGKWKLVKIEGGRMPKEERIVTFAGNSVIFEKQSMPILFRIDPTKTPKWIDIKDDFFGIEWPGIYQVDKNKLVLYIITEGKNAKTSADRPKNFDEKCPGQILYLERVKN